MYACVSEMFVFDLMLFFESDNRVLPGLCKIWCFHFLCSSCEKQPLTGPCCHIIESLRLEKTSKIVRFNHQTIPTMPTDCVPQGHVSTGLEHLQERWVHHLPGQPVPQHSFWEQISPNMQPETVASVVVSSVINRETQSPTLNSVSILENMVGTSQRAVVLPANALAPALLCSATQVPAFPSQGNKTWEEQNYLHSELILT